MSKFIKKFEEHSDYVSFLRSADYTQPHISLCMEEGHINFNFKRPILNYKKMSRKPFEENNQIMFTLFAQDMADYIVKIIIDGEEKSLSNIYVASYDSTSGGIVHHSTTYYTDSDMTLDNTYHTIEIYTKDVDGTTDYLTSRTYNWYNNGTRNVLEVKFGEFTTNIGFIDYASVVYLPHSLENIEDYTFNSNTQEIYYDGTVAEFAELTNSFSEKWNEILYPQSGGERYINQVHCNDGDWENPDD